MAAVLASNWLNAKPGDPAFAIATNITNWFNLGEKNGQDFWLEGEIVGDGEFLFNGRLFLPHGHASSAGTIIDSFPKAPAPLGWTKQPRIEEDGYNLISDDGKTILFGYRIIEYQIPSTKPNRICLVTANIYTANGLLVAESLPDQLRLYRGPLQMGRTVIR
jgi:hypothetical protein